MQLVTSPAHDEEISKVEVFNVENCGLTCFSRSGHQFILATKDTSVEKNLSIQQNHCLFD